jgi:hypothetical protein
MHRALAAPSEEEKPMRVLRILTAVTLTLLAAVATAQAQRVSPSMPSPGVSGGGGFTPQNRQPSVYFNPKEITIEKSNAWANKNKSKRRPGQGTIHCQPPNC